MKYKIGDIVLMKMTVIGIDAQGAVWPYKLTTADGFDVYTKSSGIFALVKRVKKAKVETEPSRVEKSTYSWRLATDPPSIANDVDVLTVEGRKMGWYGPEGDNGIIKGWHIWTSDVANNWLPYEDDDKIIAWREKEICYG